MNEAASQPAPVARRRIWVRVVVALLALACLGILFARFSAAEVLREMQRGDALAMLPVAAVGVLVSLPVVTTGDWLVVARCLGGPRYADLLRGVSGAATLNALGYVANMGGYGVWLARASGASPARAAGVVLYLVTSELTGVAALGGAALAAGVVPLPAAVRWSGVGLAAVLLLLKLAPGRERWAARLASGIAEPWRLVARARAWAEIGVRVAQIGVWVVSSWAAANAFGIAVPFGVMAAYLPAILMVGALPFNFAGVGAVQGAWLLLVPWARSPEQVLAFALLWPLMSSALIVLRGLPFLRRAVAVVERGGASPSGAIPS
jgi:hypothetical protein